MKKRTEEQTVSNSSLSPEKISDPLYWQGRLMATPSHSPHHAIYKCPLKEWTEIEVKHRSILARHVRAGHSVLDVGCGWGRLLTLLSPEWIREGSRYLGVDLSPDFIDMARRNHPPTSAMPPVDFVRGDVRTAFKNLNPIVRFDWAVIISFRPMIKRHLGDEQWDLMEAEIRRLAQKLLYLEYDINDEGSVE